MFCPNCGAQVQDGQQFCTNCGASMTPQAAPPGTPPSPAAYTPPAAYPPAVAYPPQAAYAPPARRGISLTSILALVCVAVAAVGVFLPWAELMGYVAVGTDGDGWIVLGIAGLGLIGALIGLVSSRAARGGAALCLLSGLGIAGVAGYDIYSVLTTGMGINVGVGLIMCAAGGVLLVLVALIGLISGK